MQVKWDQDKCQHAGVCVKSLPEVFKVVDGNFVIDASQAADEDIRKVTGQCPAGAFSVTE
ncbi:MAG: hypothetical protein DRQ61_05585 [Gammaproteobacteria bacterium]|nr:MAG: hypothetical protein DRQ56_03160 [Gammaproteobacteria bacterium]RLA22753.1 MAG: hypothetical protein DRQ61_05585 [Gammaproteobacteria bacterium]